MNKTRQTILYAEDEATDAFFLERALRRAGMPQHLVVVPNGQAAIDYLQNITRNDLGQLPSLVLLDLNMPGISGLEVLQWIRSTPGLESLVTVIFSSSEHPSDIRAAYALGANGYLVKPCTIDEAADMAKHFKDHWLKHENASQATPASISK